MNDAFNPNKNNQKSEEEKISDIITEDLNLIKTKK